MIRRAAFATVALLLLGGCAPTVTGTATWPGARLDRALLTAADFPPGVHYERITKDPGTADGAGGPPPMLSKPEGCTDGLTRDIAAGAQRGPGSAAEYVAAYDGARMVITVLTWPLDLDRLAATAARCAEFQTFFAPTDPGIPMTTTRLSTPRPDALVYEQTMHLAGADSTVYFSFENLGATAVFGIAFPTDDPSIPVKGTLPQTFLDVVSRQAERAQAA
ncbi:hypothetical protein [Mycolicibacterium psychrotolerans]|uniref:Sensor domain-containing protein n=1 Tax=Mycolicibacterium psychrotolerans TaxID=216929 RepID=A0A7I7MF46_9MYCO|nr:hypothetical protein [Mycolicibacterium psychrotolerans]BBX70934.1 hypothetical protein MPSYJ_43950 [Mycolicibacterium psychrotolerans]